MHSTMQVSTEIAMREALLKAQADDRYYLNRCLELAQTAANQAAEIADLKARLAKHEPPAEKPSSNKEKQHG